jgi:hypothetical protein
MLPESDSNHPVDPRILDIIIDGFKRLQEGQVELASSIVGKDVFCDHKEACRANFTEVFDRVLAIESALGEQGVSLARVESTAFERARAEDNKLLEAFDKRMCEMEEKFGEGCADVKKLREEMRPFRDFCTVFSFSRCSVNWVLKHKAGVAAAFATLSAWFFAIDLLSRAGCGLLK